MISTNTLPLPFYKKENNTKLYVFIAGFILSYILTIEGHAQPIFPALKTSRTPIPAPVAPGAPFAISLVTGMANTNAPGVAEWTRTAGPDESLVLTGTNFSLYTGDEEGKDTRYTVYGSDGIPVDASIQRIDSDKSIITLPKNLPPWSMYLIWPGNEAGYGAPIAVNKTEGWWIGPDNTTKGITVSVFGRNLSQDNGMTTSNVYLKPATGTGQWAMVTSVNPYKVDFTVPSTLSNGTYEVWIHNGHGGQYGWSGPLSLTVSGSIDWVDTVFNVRDFGAKGNEANDDTEAITNAILAAEKVPYSTVYFPAGTYMVNNTVYLKSKVRYKGESKNNTIIRCSVEFSSSTLGMLNGESVSNYEIENLTLEGDNNFKGELAPILLRRCQQVRLNEIKFSFQGHSILNLDVSKYVFITNCEFIGMSSFLGTCSQLFIDKCQFKMTNDSELALHSWGGIGVSLTNSTCQDFDNSDPGNGSGWGKGRFFVGNGNWGSSRSTYIGNNVTINLAPRPSSGVDQNTGEQFLWEGLFTDWTGTASSSNGLITTLSNFTSLTNPEYVRYAVIIKGKGLGQSRQIVAYDGSKIMLSSPWNVPPDAQSQISIGNYADRIVLYNNKIDGKQSAVDSLAHNASAGIEPYGGVFNFIADNNTIQEVRYGIANWATEHSDRVDPNYFSFYSNNKLINCRWGIHNALQINKAAGIGMLGNMYRNNVITVARESGIVSTVTTAELAPLNSLVYEHNTISGVKNGFSTGGDAGLPTVFLTESKGLENQLLYKNNIASSSNGYGIKVTPKIALRENVFSGFSTLYNGSLSGIVIEAPYHVIEMAGQTGGEVIEAAFPLWNSGTTAMNWKISSNASWLTFSASSGTILDQNGHTTIDLRANSTGLKAAYYYVATVTMTAGDQTKQYTVVFKVTDATSVAFVNVRPNPFQEKITIEFTVSENADAILQIFNSNGVLLETQSKSATGAQTTHIFEFDGRKYASSFYICKLICGKTTLTEKLILIK